MKIGTTSKPNCAAQALLRRLADAPGKLKSRFEKMYAAHEARIASLRAFDSTRLDGSKPEPDPVQSVPSATAAGAGAGDGSAKKRFERLKNPIRRWYRLHQARVAALRVYSRNRIDRDRSTEAGR